MTGSLLIYKPPKMWLRDEVELDFAHRSLKRKLYQLESWSRKDFIGLLTKIYSVLLCQMTTNSNNEEELNDPESLNYMFNHQGSATQNTRGFDDINGSFGTDGGYDARSTMGAQSPPSVLSIIAGEFPPSHVSKESNTGLLLVRFLKIVIANVVTASSRIFEKQCMHLVVCSF